MKSFTQLAGFGLWVATTASAEPVPAPTGPYNVGVSKHVVPFVNEDNVSPGNLSTEYLVTLFYPTADNAPCAAKPYVDPVTAELYAEVLGYNISHLTSTVRWDAAFLDEAVGPTLIFQPGGWGPPTEGYTILLSDLASKGYVVAAIDHPYEQPFVRYPNGTGIVGLAIDFNPDDLSFVNDLHEVRVEELVHFAEHLPAFAAELGAPFETSSVGAFGHSLGGSASLATLGQSEVVVAAINLDGTNWGSLADPVDLKKPSFLLGSEIHIVENDETWAKYVETQTGWLRLVTVNQTVHRDWSDVVWWQQYGSLIPIEPIDPHRGVELTRDLVTAFFDEHLKGVDGSILDGPSEEYPEVVFRVVQN